MNIFEKCKNTKSQGNVGIAKAISDLTQLGFIVSVPLTDCQDYDLLIDDGKGIYRVQVKTTSFKPKNNFFVNLSVKGGNRSYNTIKLFNRTRIQFLYVLTSENVSYFIPTSAFIATGGLSLYDKYNEFKI